MSGKLSNGLSPTRNSELEFYITAYSVSAQHICAAYISHLPAEIQVPVDHRHGCDHNRGVETEMKEQEHREVVEAKILAVVENQEGTRAYVCVLNPMGADAGR